jgi:hypothetical protein
LATFLVAAVGHFLNIIESHESFFHLAV